MKKTGKRLSNPFSTGGGGGHFEAHVQASFVALMLAGGFVPCLPCWPISKIKLQGKFSGYDTDDLIVFISNQNNTQHRKMLAQIKHSIGITENNKIFGEVIQAAWNDFNNPDVFTKERDVIALITGPLSATDMNDVRIILEWARHSENASEFYKKVELTNFSSQNKKIKLKAFKSHLTKANGNKEIVEEEVFQFLKHFHLLGYDLDIKAGVTLSLLHSLIGQHAPDNAQSLWVQLVDEVQSANKNAGTINRENISENIRTIFERRNPEVIPEAFSLSPAASELTDWNKHIYASDLTIANLLGAWNEKSAADLQIVQQFISVDYTTWIGRLREILQLPDSPLSLKNGKWSIKNRKALWNLLGTRLFDNHLDIFKQAASTVLSEEDPKFELPVAEHYAATIHGKVLSHSGDLRKGISEGLVLLGGFPNALSNTTQGKAEGTALTTVRKIFVNANWVLWGSLNNLLPILAEAAPDEFLTSVESALQMVPCPFDELFSQEGDGITGGNYLTGLLWALETLAWDQVFLVRACVILAHIASHDPGGKWSNRPSNSLSTILLPWLPQTTAPIDKRKVTVETLKKEHPLVAWKLLLSLLPNQHQMSSGTHKPQWRNVIPDDINKSVSRKDYLEQVSFYSELAVSIACHDFEKLIELVGFIGNLQEAQIGILLAHISSESIKNRPESERLTLWTKLTAFTQKHRRFADAKWALSSDAISKIETTAALLAPVNPLNLHLRLFSSRDMDLYAEAGSWEEKQKALEKRRCEAIKEILTYGGINTVIKFAESTESPHLVGHSLGTIADETIDQAIIPLLLLQANKKIERFIGGYVWSRQDHQGWSWVDDLDKSLWSIQQTATFLSYLKFDPEAWTRAKELLGDSEKEYWIRANVNPYQIECDLNPAIDKLIEFGRPHAAIDCLARIRFDKQPLDKTLSIRALLTARFSDEPSYAIDTHNITEIIKALQADPNVTPDDIFEVEWAYLPLLERHNDVTPKTLENRLASDPAFFSEVISAIYKAKNQVEPEKSHTEQEKTIANNAWRLLHEWQTPPGTLADNSFSKQLFSDWLKQTKELCIATDRLDVALIHIGHVLFYCPADPAGLWIDQEAAEAINASDAGAIRDGFSSEAYNSRGVHWVDPSAKPERELAEHYRQRANDVENAGYQRFAVTLRNLAESYDREAERIIADRKQEEPE